MSDLCFGGRRLFVKVDNQTPASWAGIVSQFADASIYQSWAYGAVRWGQKNLSHLTIYDDGKLLAAAQVRIIRTPLLRTGVAYVRWGPMCHLRNTPIDPLVARSMLDCLNSEYCKRRGLALIIIANAFQECESGAVYLSAFRKSGFHRHLGLPSYRTHLVDLTPSNDGIRKRFDQKWRNQLNASERNSLELEVRRDLAGYHDFQRLYQIMCDAKQFATNVDVSEFGRIQEQLSKDHKMMVFLARRGGELVAALVCSQIGNSAIYLLGATTGHARELKASYYLHWQAMMWLRGLGAICYDLGGIDPETNPGGYHFKSGFSGTDVMQIPAFSISGSMLGDVMINGLSWIHRCRG